MDIKNEELSELNQVKNKLLSVLAHDVQSPLNSIKGVLDLVKGEDISAEKGKELLLKIGNQVQYTQGLLMGIVTWAKTQLSGIEVNMTRIDIEKVMFAEFENIKHMTVEKSIELYSTVDLKDKNFSSDKEIICLLLRNLLSNAVKFSNVGGKVGVMVSKEFGNVVIEVTDNGIGMSKEKLADLFKLGASQTFGTQQEKGFGLGLLLCYEYAKVLGVNIEVESEIGSGTTFRLIFPFL